MKTVIPAGISGAVVVFLIWTLSVSTEAGGDKKADPWRPMLPAKIYKELVKRDLQMIEKALGSDDFAVIDRGKVSAAMIVAHTKSLKEKVGHPEGVRAAAKNLAEILENKSKAAEARKLIKAIASYEGITPPKEQDINFKSLFLDDDYLMLAFEFKDKGGDGIHPDLQVSKRLQGSQNSIENLINYLTRRALSESRLKKAAEELELLAYWTAVSGSVTYEFKPKRKIKDRDPAVWVKTSLDMIDSAHDMALAANKRDADAIQKAAIRLETSCIECHRLFRIE